MSSRLEIFSALSLSVLLFFCSNLSFSRGKTKRIGFEISPSTLPRRWRFLDVLARVQTLSFTTPRDDDVSIDVVSGLDIVLDFTSVSLLPAGHFFLAASSTVLTLWCFLLFSFGHLTELLLLSNPSSRFGLFITLLPLLRVSPFSCIYICLCSSDP